MPVSDEFPERFGPFVLLRSLGVGGMGTAYLALHTETDALLVVKRMHPELMSEATIFKRFVHEAEVAAHVRHPNVAALIAMGSVDREPFLATEFVFGIQLSEIVERVETSVIDRVPLPIALHLSAELLSGLGAIHDARHQETGAPLGLIHRDVGARNVLVGFDGLVRLIDLGLGKSILADWQTAHQIVAGSPDYMAPEQAMGAEVDGRADVYAAAVTIWELLVGKKRIREETIASRLQRAIEAQPEPLLVHRAKAPRRLEAVLQMAMDPDPAIRTPTPEVFKRALVDATRKEVVDKEQVIAWLDSACATYIAKQRRGLDEARALAARMGRVRERPNTQLFVQGNDEMFASLSSPYQFYNTEAPAQESPPVEASDSPGRERRGALARLLSVANGPAVTGMVSMMDPQGFRKASSRERATFLGGLLGILLLIAAITAVIVSPERPGVTAVGLPTRMGAPPVPPKSPVKKLTPPAPPPEPPPVDASPTEPPVEAVEPPPPPVRAVSAQTRARKKALLKRVRRLRKKNFEIDWQRKLTKLSTRLSRARSARSLDEIEARLRKMEREP